MANKEKNFMSAVIYVHNSEKRIEEFLGTIIDALENNFEHSEIICVDDCSDDTSIEKIKKMSSIATTTSISVLKMSYFHGVEMAMNAGVDLSIGDFVLEFDSTLLDFDKSEIMRIYRRSLEGYDIVSASPDKKQKFSSRIFYSIFDKFTNLSSKMYSERFRILSRRVINRISSMNKTVPYRKAVYANCGLKTANIVYKTIGHIIEDIDKKESRYRKGLAIDTLILFTDVGYKFSITMTMLMMFVTAFMVVYSILVYLTSTPIEGWTTTILFLSIAFLGVFGGLTIIIKYLQLLIDLVFKRKRYSFQVIEKLTK